MKKRVILLTVVGLLLLMGTLGGIKGLQIKSMIAQGQQFVPPPETVTTASVRAASWESLLPAIGSLEAVQGVLITAELSGKVARIAFEPGTKVKAGDLLVQQDTTSEMAQLRSAEATVALTRLNFERAEQLLPEKVISQSDYDNAVAQYKQAQAQVDTIRAVIAKKTIRAPFSGRLGIRLVNLGQILNEGEGIVSLQALDPIFVNFQLPQQQLAQVKLGLPVRITSDAITGKAIQGEITAINPEVDASTRNIRVQATVSNADEQMRPGMFVNVSVVLPVAQKLLAIPATSVLYAPYSDSVFVVEAGQDQKSPDAAKVVHQQFVRLGEKRGDFVAILSGLKEGQTIVSTGVFKLRNGQSVVVDNSLSPKFKLAPEPEES